MTDENLFQLTIDFLTERGYKITDYSEMAGTNRYGLIRKPFRGGKYVSKSDLIALAYTIAKEELDGRQNQLTKGGT